MPRIVDLTLRLSQGMRGVEFTTSRRLETDGWNARTLHLYSHAGTHADAPAHFLPGGKTLDELSLEYWIGPAWVVDLTFLEPRQLIVPEHLEPWADRIVEGNRLLLRTGWSRHFGQDDYRTHFPRVSVELSRWLVERHVSLIGVDTPSVADVDNREELTAVHRTLLAGGIVIVEDLTNLDQLRAERVQFIVLPLKIEAGDGAPARAIAIENDARESGA